MNFHLDYQSVNWITPVKLDVPGQGEIHIWRFDLNYPPPGFENRGNWLNHNELSRADRFYFFSDGRRWRFARAYLRLVLANYLKIAPQSVQIDTTEHGKPFLPKNFK
ncbi:MAG: hypothetical protein AAFY36_17735, partial [Bacteroidota bacterium]